MTLIFWQGIISIHQKSFLEALARCPEVTKVVLAVETEITPYREKMGWAVPQFEGVEVVIAKDDPKINQVFADHPDAVHVLGGLASGVMMTAALREGIRRKARLGIMTEPFDRRGWKGLLRTAVYRFRKLRYGRHISFVLAIGREGVDSFRSLGFPDQIIFPWAYFISVARVDREKRSGQVTKMLYAGRIEPAKGIARFVNELVISGQSNFKFDIYGSGPDEEQIKSVVSKSAYSDNIRIHPFLPHDELLKLYSRYDCVVLPSAGKDGWGVIISEGLLNGCRAICSTNCGVSWAIQPGVNGVVFDWEVPNSCQAAIGALLQPDTFASPSAIRAMADQSLSAAAGASYFLNILDTVFHANPRPKIPWAR